MVTAAHPPGIIDTDIVIDARPGLPDGVHFLAAQRAAGGIVVSVVTAMELVAGCQNKSSVRRIEQFLATVTMIPLSPTSSSQALQ